MRRFLHVCPRHGREPCPGLTAYNGGQHACREDATLRFDTPEIISTDLPGERLGMEDYL